MARTPLNDQVMTVIQLLAVVSREPLDLGLFAALRWIRENPAQDTLDWAVRAVNDAVRRHPDLDGLTLREAIEREHARGQEEWKEFDFRLVERILRDDGQQSHIDPTAELPPAGEPATVIRVGARVTRVELAVGTAAMFNDCPGLADIGEPALGDLLSVRVRAHPDGPIVARIYAREERGVAGEVRYVDGAGYSFFRPDGDDGDVFVPPHAHRQAGHPAVGDRIMARIRPTERRPEATWARAID